MRGDSLEKSVVDGMMKLRQILKKSFEAVDWLHLAQCKELWRFLANTVMNLRVKIADSFTSSRVTTSPSLQTALLFSLRFTTTCIALHLYAMLLMIPVKMHYLHTVGVHATSTVNCPWLCGNACFPSHEQGYWRLEHSFHASVWKPKALTFFFADESYIFITYGHNSTWTQNLDTLVCFRYHQSFKSYRNISSCSNNKNIQPQSSHWFSC